MANSFLALPAPAGNASGAQIDVSAMGATKTIVVEGNGSGLYEPYVQIEVSNDNAFQIWTPIYRFLKPGSVTLTVACRYMRATTQNYVQGGAPTVNVGAEDSGATFFELVAPAGNGFGASVDVSAFPALKSFQVSGTFKGNLSVQISNDGGVTWSQADGLSFRNKGGLVTITIIAQFMRLARSGIQAREPNPGLPICDVGCAVQAGGGGIAGIELEQGGVAVSGGPFDTLNFVGAVVTDGGGGEANVVVSPAQAIISPAAITGAQNDYSPTGMATANAVRQDLSAAASLTGLATGAANRVVTVFNIATAVASVLTINHLNGGSIAANQFLLPNGQDWHIPVGGASTFWYDVTSAKWRLLAHVSNIMPVGTLASPGVMLGAGLTGLYLTGGTRIDVGIAASDVPLQMSAANVNVNTGFSMEPDISPPALSGSVNNYAPTGFSRTTCVRQDCSAASTITGLDGGSDGRTVVIQNIATNVANTLTLTHLSGSSDANKQFYCPNNADLVIRAGGSVTLRYDETSTKWRVTSAV